MPVLVVDPPAAPIREVLNALAAPVLVANDAWTLTDVNPAALECLGLDAETLLGRNVWDVLKLTSGDVAPTQDGNLPARLRLRPAHAPADGRLEATFARAHGCWLISLECGRKVAELAQKLDVAEQRLTWITEAIDDMFYLIDPETGQMSYVSPAYEVIWGRTRESLYADASSALQAVLEEDRPRIAGQLPIQDSRSKFDVEYRIRRPDGSIRWLHDRGYVVHGGTDEIDHYVGVVSDITARRALQDARVQIERLETVARLTAELSHDFNNVLGAIRVIASNLSFAADHAPAVVRDVGKILSAADRGSEIIRHLLAVSRQDELTPETCDLASVWPELLGLLDGALGPRIQRDSRLEAASAPLHIDRNAFVRSLLNIAVNARHAMPDGGCFTLTARRVVRRGDTPTDAAFGLQPGEYVCIEATDTGVGMDAETLARAFDAFFTTRRDDGGTGMGLAIVYAFARSSGGAVELESRLSEGTTVRLWLPVQGVSAASGADPASAADVRPMILLVDDEPLVLEGLEAFLTLRKFDVVTATTPSEALHAIGERRFDAVVTDFRLPEMNGVELATRLTAALPDLPVILISGYTGDVLECSGRWETIPKANVVSGLVPALHRLLSRERV